MGLDMYLMRKIYVGTDKYQKVEISNKKDQAAESNVKCNMKKVMYLIENVGYWRKANQIHLWFVNNVANGVDDCAPVNVSLEKLKELKALCESILASLEEFPKEKMEDKTVVTGWSNIDGEAKEHTKVIKVYPEKVVKELAQALPTQDGFFFGSTDYNMNYVQSLKHTVEIIDYMLEVDDYDDYYYEASW